jgi:hypothetical protein
LQQCCEDQPQERNQTNDGFRSLPGARIGQSITLQVPKKAGISVFNSEEETED